MEYKPRYPQPFTLSEAIALDVSVITEEISRLQNSLKHLRETQDMLKDHIMVEAPADPDPEITKAIEENEVVIGSQDERISILKMALAEKGIVAGSHYDDSPEPNPPLPTFAMQNGVTPEVEDGDSETNGIHL
ncbi:hypothetical protein BDQ12DRAFT_718665 [Crucibulum laeve]|uniref:Uncharacterized protein n=1 Tax=Crucibulum laeve TaxID=68775 RepID=A0A5C3MFL6_9AGAR|nr:hypothetical protein BDQ12DRAFT_718665 [Crucibulum laeve]